MAAEAREGTTRPKTSRQETNSFLLMTLYLLELNEWKGITLLFRY
jgi:hypothetical protein